MLNKETIEVLPLFPSPLFTAVYTDGNLDKTIKHLDSCELIDGGKASEYGFHSKDTYILEHKECKPLADFIMQSLLHFAKEILMYAYDEYAFSQSWISHKSPGQHHTMHTHPNSLISGVFYYGEEDKDIPAISFHKPVVGTNVSYLSPKYVADRRKSQYAWDSFSVNYTPGLLLLFPSYVFHSVPVNKSKLTRKSLAFNVLPKGKIGDEHSLTELLFNKVG
jgi:uncharacterized protein (TIGR02466 family)